jgi:hypothetical protein
MLGEAINAYRILVRRPLEIGRLEDRNTDGRITFGRIPMETGCEDGRWMELAQDRVKQRDLVLAALNLRVLLLES